MRLIIAMLMYVCLVRVSFAQAPNFSLVGFATQNGGTTGGSGGVEKSVTTFEELKRYAEVPDSLFIIKVVGTIKGTGSLVGKDYKGHIKLASNKTILGEGSTAFLDGVGLSISGTEHNIIIKNIKFSFVSIGKSIPADLENIPGLYSKLGDEGRAQILVNSGDLVTISGSASNIWIDHCEFFNEDPKVQTNQDLYDGLLDIKNKSQYITISWCYFHDHHKTHLVGSSDKDIYADRKVTFHHNRYENIEERLPLFRGGVAHIFNNYYSNCFGSAVNTRVNACVKVEKNYFEHVHNSVISKHSAVLGKAERIDNKEVNCTRSEVYPEACVADLGGYEYTKVLTTKVKKVKSLVLKYSGVGKIN